MQKLTQGAIPNEVLNFAITEMQKIRSGEVMFVAQDGYLMQVEINQRRRISDWEDGISNWSAETISTLSKQIRSEFSKLLYGRLVLKIQKGRVTQFEHTVQQRFTGLDGEGI